MPLDYSRGKAAVAKCLSNSRLFYGPPTARRCIRAQSKAPSYPLRQLVHWSSQRKRSLQSSASSLDDRISTEQTLASTLEPTYQPPQKGLLAKLPRSWIPYAELIRLDKPTGTLYLFFPCLFSTLLAAPYAGASGLAVVSTSLLFLSGSLIMRGAGCTINDLWDRDLDPLVARTRLRPIARGAISPQNAIFFTGVQLLAGLGILSQFPTSCLYYAIPSLLLVVTYPLAKRVTHYPQLILGLTFSWGVIVAFPALGIDLLSDLVATQAAALLYFSCVAWTVLYDMIYAHMDVKDDVKAGIKSIALRYGDNTKAVLSGLAVAQVGLLAAAGSVLGAGPAFFVVSCGSAAGSLAAMIWRVRLAEPSSCWWWFKQSAWLTGGGITLGLLSDYLIHQRKEAAARRTLPLPRLSSR